MSAKHFEKHSRTFMAAVAFRRWPKTGLPGAKTCRRVLQLVRTGEMTLVQVKQRHAHMGRWIADKLEKKDLMKELFLASKAVRYYETVHGKDVRLLQFMKKKNGKLQQKHDELQKKNKKLQEKVVARVQIHKKKTLQEKVAGRRHSGYWPNISLWPVDGLPGKSTMSLLAINAKKNKDLMPYLEEKVPIVHGHLKHLLEKNKAREPKDEAKGLGKSQCYVYLKQYQQGSITMEELQKKGAAIAKFVKHKMDYLQGRQYERYVRDLQPEYDVADIAMETQADREFYASLSALDAYAYR